MKLYEKGWWHVPVIVIAGYLVIIGMVYLLKAFGIVGVTPQNFYTDSNRWHPCISEINLLNQLVVLRTAAADTTRHKEMEDAYRGARQKADDCALEQTAITGDKYLVKKKLLGEKYQLLVYDNFWD